MTPNYELLNNKRTSLPLTQLQQSGSTARSTSIQVAKSSNTAVSNGNLNLWNPLRMLQKQTVISFKGNLKSHQFYVLFNDAVKVSLALAFVSLH